MFLLFRGAGWSLARFGGGERDDAGLLVFLLVRFVGAGLPPVPPLRLFSGVTERVMERPRRTSRLRGGEPEMEALSLRLRSGGERETESL